MSALQLYLTSWSFQNLSNLPLKLFTDSALTTVTVSGKLLIDFSVVIWLWSVVLHSQLTSARNRWRYFVHKKWLDTHTHTGRRTHRATYVHKQPHPCWHWLMINFGTCTIDNTDCSYVDHFCWDRFDREHFYLNLPCWFSSLNYSDGVMCFVDYLIYRLLIYQNMTATEELKSAERPKRDICVDYSRYWGRSMHLCTSTRMCCFCGRWKTFGSSLTSLAAATSQH